jgi:hypothetical protein
MDLFEEIGIKAVKPTKQRRKGAAETHCGRIVARLIDDLGVEHTRLVLLTIVETKGNAGQLTRPVILAVSDIILSHRRWTDSGFWLQAFDQISLADVWERAKATKISAREAIATLLFVELERLLGPSVPPKPSRS